MHRSVKIKTFVSFLRFFIKVSSKFGIKILVRGNSLSFITIKAIVSCDFLLLLNMRDA